MGGREVVPTDHRITSDLTSDSIQGRGWNRPGVVVWHSLQGRTIVGTTCMLSALFGFGPVKKIEPGPFDSTVEPVFGNLRHNKRLDRFTLRGRQKVDTQWKLYCLVHNIEKLAHHGYGQ